MFCGKTTEETEKTIDETQKWESKQENLQQCKFKKCSYLNTIGNMLQNQLTYMKAMKTY